MASITRRGNKYRVLIRCGNQPAISKTFTRKADAAAWARSVEVAIEKGEYSQGNGVTLADAIDRYLEEQPRLKGGKLALGVTIPSCEKTYLRWWRERLGRKPLTDLTKSDFSDARSDLSRTISPRTGKPLSPASVNRRVARISAVLTICVKEWDWCQTNPVLELSQYVEKARDRYLSDAELKSLLFNLDCTDEPAIKPLVLLALTTGRRATEHLGIRWRDIHWESGTIYIWGTKNGAHSTAYIQPVAREAIEQLWEGRDRDPDQFVFQGKHGRVPFHYHPSWDLIRTAAGLHDFRFHDLRHSAASFMAMAGRSLAEIAAVLGHKSERTTQRYAHFAEDHRRATAGVLGEKVKLNDK